MSWRVCKNKACLVFKELYLWLEGELVQHCQDHCPNRIGLSDPPPILLLQLILSSPLDAIFIRSLMRFDGKLFHFISESFFTFVFSKTRQKKRYLIWWRSECVCCEQRFFIRNFTPSQFWPNSGQIFLELRKNFLLLKISAKISTSKLPQFGLNIIKVGLEICPTHDKNCLPQFSGNEVVRTDWKSVE